MASTEAPNPLEGMRHAFDVPLSEKTAEELCATDEARNMGQTVEMNTTPQTIPQNPSTVFVIDPDQTKLYPPGWRPHAHKSIAVDFDGVIHSYISPWEDAHIIPDPPVWGSFRWLEEMAGHFHVIIFSTRCLTKEGQLAVKLYLTRPHDQTYSADRHEVMPQYTSGIDPRLAETFEYTAQKEAALIYLDDRGVRFTGSNFPTKREIYELLPWNKRLMNDRLHRI